MATLLSIEEIMTGSAAAVEQVKSTAEETKKLRTKQAEASGRQAAIIDQASKDAEAVARQQGLAALAVQQENNKAAAARGVTESSNALLDLLAAQKDASKRVLAKAAEVRDKWNSTIERDGLLGWLKNGLTVDMSQQELEAQIKETQVISNELTNANNALQQTFATNKGKAEVLTAETIAAQARIAAADAKVRSEQAVIEGIGYNIQSLAEAKNSTIEQLNVKYGARQAVSGIKAEQRAEESQSLERERFNWQKEEAKIRQDLLNAEKKDKQEAKQLSEDFVATVNMGRATLKLPALDAVQQRELLNQFRAGQVRKDISLHYELGIKSRQNGGKQVLGNSPAAAAAVVFDPELDVQVSAAQEETKNILAAAIKGLPIEVKNSKDKAAVAREVNKNVQQIVAEQFGTKEGVAGKGYIGIDSPFSVGDLGAPESGYLSAPVLANMPLVTKVLQPLATAGTKLQDPKAVLEIARAAIRKGEITSSQAAEGLSRVYQVANLMNQAQRNFAGYGIQLPNGGAQYIVRIGSEKIDLTRPEQVTRHLMRPPASPFTRTDSPFLN